MSYNIEERCHGAANVVEGDADQLEAKIIEGDHAHKHNAQRQHRARHGKVVLEYREHLHGRVHPAQLAEYDACHHSHHACDGPGRVGGKARVLADGTDKRVASTMAVLSCIAPTAS